MGVLLHSEQRGKGNDIRNEKKRRSLFALLKCNILYEAYNGLFNSD